MLHVASLVLRTCSLDYATSIVRRDVINITSSYIKAEPTNGPLLYMDKQVVITSDVLSAVPDAVICTDWGWTPINIQLWPQQTAHKFIS